MADANAPTKPGAADPAPDTLDLLATLAEIEGVIVTEGMVDLSVLAPEDTTYRIATREGVRELLVPGDPPFPVSLGFLRARDRFSRAEQAVAEANGESEDLEEAAVDRFERAWDELVAALAKLLCTAQEVTAEEIDELGQQSVRGLIGAVWLQLIGARLRPFEGEKPPKASPTPAARRATKAATSS